MNTTHPVTCIRAFEDQWAGCTAYELIDHENDDERFTVTEEEDIDEHTAAAIRRFDARP